MFHGPCEVGACEFSCEFRLALLALLSQESRMVDSAQLVAIKQCLARLALGEQDIVYCECEQDIVHRQCSLCAHRAQRILAVVRSLMFYDSLACDFLSRLGSN